MRNWVTLATTDSKFLRGVRAIKRRTVANHIGEYQTVSPRQAKVTLYGTAWNPLLLALLQTPGYRLPRPLNPPPSVPLCPVITFVITKVWQSTWLLVLLVCCFFRLDVTPNGLTTCESPFALSRTWMFSRENLIALMKPNKWQTRSLTM